jgi:von Willebrand factor type A domain
MNHTASHAAPGPEPSITAWTISAVFHVSMILLLALAINEVPRRGASLSGNSPGIVLKMESSEGDAYQGEDGPGDSAGSVELIAPPESIAARLEEPPPIDVRIESALIVVPEPVVAAASQRESRLPKPLANTAPATSATAPRSTNDFATPEGRAGSPARQNYAHVRVFGVEGTGNKFVYVFDRSASMEGPPLAAAKRQLIQSLDSLAGVHQFQIIFFNHRLQAFDISGGGKRIAFGSDRNKQLAANFVGGITAEGGTDRFAALKAALVFRPDVIFFLTDADDPMPDSELEEIELGSQRFGSRICVIEFGRQATPWGDNFLQALARQTGGQYGYVNTTRLTAAVR